MKPSVPRDSSIAPGIAGRVAATFIDSKLTPLLIIASLLLGIFSVMVTPREEEPQIQVPMIDVMVGLPGAAPAEVERLVTLPLEQRLAEIPGVEYVYAASQPSGAMVTARFKVGDDPERSLVKVYDRLVANMADSPPGATPPLVKSRSIDDVPILVLTLSSERYGSAELRRVGAELRRQLMPIDGVSTIALIGGERRELRILPDHQRLAAVGLDAGALIQSLQGANLSAPAGQIHRGGEEVLIETGAFLRSPEEVANLVVGAGNGKPIYLRDVARLEDTTAEVADYVLYGEGAALGGADTGLKPALTLAIAKRRGADAHDTVAAIQQRLATLRQELLPADIALTTSRDYGATASQKADELLLHLGVAVLAVTLMLGLFLGWRGAVVVLVSVPISFAFTLLVYYLFGYTLNRVTLFALVFVTGIVVDDSIIVVENMVRHFARRGPSPLRAAIEAIDEVGNPTILATWTVIASVLPMAFVRGLMGPYMRPMPIGASLAMLFSLLVALIAAPYLGYRLLQATGHHEEGIGKMERGYRRLLEVFLDRRGARWMMLGGVFVLLLASMALVPAKWVTVKMLPFDNKSELQVLIDLPEGSPLEETARAAREMADILRREPEVRDVTVFAGTASPINFNGLVRHYDYRRGSHLADLAVQFVAKEERDAQSHDLARRLRPLAEGVASHYGAAIKVVEVPPGPPVLSTLVAEIYAPTAAARAELATQVAQIFRQTAGVVDVDTLVESPQSKTVWQVDQEKAALRGISPAQAVMALRWAIGGLEVGALHVDDDLERVPIQLQMPRSDRFSVADLAAIEVQSRQGGLHPLKDLVRVTEKTSDRTLYRKNLRGVDYVIGDVAGTQESPVYAIFAMEEAVNALGVQQLFKGEPSSEAPTVLWDGEWQITLEVFRDLGLAFAGVLVLIYLLIVGWFRSFGVPIVMMIAIPLSLVGILPAHWLFGAFFTATSMIGFIALAGIMVRNSVLLIDFVDLALARGASLRDAVLEAGAVRMRPILLTAGAVAVGSFVILFDPIFQGLAISLLAGSVASTVLTLLVVPVVHFLLAPQAAPEAAEVP